MKIKKIGITIILMAMMLMLSGGGVKAVLQANPNTHGVKTLKLSSWISQVRQMEAAGGAMGLNETIGADLTSSESNGIDVHLIKTTEYGAMAILSASEYGNESNAQSMTTTTGNNTGVMLNGQWEWTAGSAGAGIPSGADARYYDLYTTSSDSAKAGDALGSATTTNPGCQGWHRASDHNWLYSTSASGFVRGSGGVFSFHGNSYSVDDGNVNNSGLGRAVVVCGAGL